MLCGSFFSSAGLVIVGYSEEYGIREWSGFFIAIWSLGSGISALIIGTIKWKRSEATRFLESLFLLFVLTIPIYLVAILRPENLILMESCFSLMG